MRVNPRRGSGVVELHWRVWNWKSEGKWDRGVEWNGEEKRKDI